MIIMILYVKDNCPNCEVVKKYIKGNLRDLEVVKATTDKAMFHLISLNCLAVPALEINGTIITDLDKITDKIKQITL